jgi:hypothetical protein
VSFLGSIATTLAHATSSAKEISLKVLGKIVTAPQDMESHLEKANEFYQDNK